jgi:hypothetical protein
MLKVASKKMLGMTGRRSRSDWWARIRFGDIICEYWVSTVTEKDMVIQVLPSRWNASRSFASYLDARPELYRNRNVLELGAGGGLPGLLCALNGAQKVHIIALLPRSLYSNVPNRSC